MQMFRLILLLAAVLSVLMAFGCRDKLPQTKALRVGVTDDAKDQSESGDKTAAGPPRKVVMLFDAVATDPWVAEMMNTLSSELGVDLWGEREQVRFVDQYGPHAVTVGDFKVILSIGLLPFDTVPGIEGQKTLGEDGLAWAREQQPELAWLDGDKAQYHIGRFLAAEVPVVYTGVMLPHEVSYEADAAAVGVQRRHSVLGTLGALFELDPEAKVIALASGDSPLSLGRVTEFLAAAEMLPEGVSFMRLPPVESWERLGQLLSKLQDEGEADAVVFCGLDESGAATALQEQPCPADLLSGFELPCVALGPTQLEQAGVLSLRVKPSAHAKSGLDYLKSVLGGMPPILLPVSVPEEMRRFQIEIEPIQ